MGRNSPRSGRILAWALIALVGASGCGGDSGQPPPFVQQTPQADIGQRVHEFCAACHEYPPADTFPRDAWRLEVPRGYDFFSRAGRNLKAPPMQEVVDYYAGRA